MFRLRKLNHVQAMNATSASDGLTDINPDGAIKATFPSTRDGNCAAKATAIPPP